MLTTVAKILYPLSGQLFNSHLRMFFHDSDLHSTADQPLPMIELLFESYCGLLVTMKKNHFVLDPLCLVSMVP